MRTAKVAAQLASIVLVASLLGLLAWRVTTADKSDVGDALARGEQPAAPRFTLPRLDGRGDFSLASLRGKVVVVNFWATWCDPCTREAPVLASAHRRWSKQGVEFVGVDVKDFTGDARKFVRKRGLTYVHVRDPVAKTALEYDVLRYPETFLIGPEHRIVERIQGELTRDELDEAIERALRA